MTSVDDGQLIAIIGMACRFPGAQDAATFWANLAAGVESLTQLDGMDEFDAEFFGYTDGEAVLLEPQQRIFLETCWEAMEDAGHDPTGHRDLIGVYAGSSETAYAAALRTQRRRLAFASDRQIRLATGIDFLTTRVAYKLGLRGPAVTVMTACSTSLVAIHTAGSALLGGDCDMALAGGVTAHLWRDNEEGDGEGLISPDGHCRAFDAKAAGTAFTDGAGVVVLKRLADAKRDRDNIRAVILGSSINNDGSAKIGFLAPSVDGQARVIRDAHLAAGVDPDTIGYVEAHGTGTPLGDPIEIAALTQAFRLGTDRVGYCPIGTVKTNIGHTDAAAGAAGVIKTVLALEHGLLPPSLNFESPNPEIDFGGSPFFVTTESRPWRRGRLPRRAGVSALGLGGTNAHLVLEEPPPVTGTDERPTRPLRLLAVSARGPASLDTASARLAGYLLAHQDVDLADVEWTLQTGRRAHPYRRHVVCADSSAAVATLGQPTVDDQHQAVVGSVAFTFPGLGGQHAGMGRELYAHEPEFRTWIDECATLALPRLGVDLRTILSAGPEDIEARNLLADTGISQPAVFAMEYALARQLLNWGIRPDVLVGHSLGAYAAACVAGVFSLRDALALVVERGRLLRTVPAGAMLAVPLPDTDVTPLLTDDLDVAVVNSPTQCVIAGPTTSIAELRARLDANGVDTHLLRVPVPAHSRYVVPIMAEFEELVRAVPRRAPDIPVLSELTGAMMAEDEITDPAYWSSHLRRTVRFGAALDTLFERQGLAVFEVGPGQALTAVLRRHPGRPAGVIQLPIMPHPRDDTPEQVALLSSVGRFWSAGGVVDWAALHKGRQPRRVPLPTYPFQRKRYRVDPLPDQPAAVSTPEPLRQRESEHQPVVSAELGETYRQMAEAFCRVLGVARVSPQDSFFALGGDSVIAAQLVRAARHLFELPIKLRAVFEHPTVAGLARHVDELRQQEQPPAQAAEGRPAPQ